VFPKLELLWIVDFFDFLLIGLTLLFALTSHAPLMLVCQAFLCNTMTNILRMTTVAITSLPDPREGCEIVKGDPFDSLSLHRCGDAMFSGHTAIYAICALVWSSYCYHAHGSVIKRVLYILGAVAVWALAIVGTLFILMNRSHYSMDVLVAWYISIGCWYVLLWFWQKLIVAKGRLQVLTYPHGVKRDALNGWRRVPSHPEKQPEEFTPFV
jgi:membrane-associated phospholipid phosphatase